MQDAWRAYLELAFGLTEASRKKAMKAAKELAGRGEATAAQLQSLAEDLLSTSRANREALARLVRSEVDRALGALGLATVEEVAELNNRIRDLEQQVRAAQQQPEPQPEPPKPTKKTVAKKAVAKKAVAKKAAPRKATKTTAAKTTAKKAAG